MKRRLALLLVLAGTYLATRTAVAQAMNGRSPSAATLALHSAAIPLTQLALLEIAFRLRARWRGAE